MPQGGRRKLPFSGKAKKAQLQVKRQTKGTNSSMLLTPSGSTNDFQTSSMLSVQKLNHQPNRGNQNTNRYALQFQKESEAEVRQLKEEARHSIIKASLEDLEITNDYYFEGYEFPKRPPWSFDMSIDILQRNENKYFTNYIRSLEKLTEGKPLSYFELNLETWRQLWRVLEISDVILIIVDIRFPVLMFPPSLYTYTTDVLNKDMILVLNKIDLAPPSLVLSWKHYFNDKYPKLHVLMFTSFPGYNIRGNTEHKGMTLRRRKGKLRMAAEGAELLLKVCKSIVQNQVDLSSWEEKIIEENNTDFESDEVEILETITQPKETSFETHKKYNNGILTIGCVGQPNVGKSSLMNALMGKKVVSVSKTPGHTKHFQTIFLTNTVRLCDCPGLVFPSSVPKKLQILMGSFPIAQVKEPFSSIRYVAERLELPKLLRIAHPDNDETWSVTDICEAWALKKGFITAKAARPDLHRAANSLLRMILEGSICLGLRPPGYTAKEEFWNCHPELERVKHIQAMATETMASLEDLPESDEDEESTPETNDNELDSNTEDSDDNITSSNKFSALTNEM